MALKVRCVFCDEMTTYDQETDTYTCLCGTTIQLPAGKAESNPYSDWGKCFKSDMKRKRPDATSSNNNRGRKGKKKTGPALWGPYYGNS